MIKSKYVYLLNISVVDKVKLAMSLTYDRYLVDTRGN